MKKDEKLMISFKGDKKEIKRQLQSYCVLAGETMNGTVIEIIEKFLINKK